MAFKKILQGILKGKEKKPNNNTQFEETEQASELDSDMAGMLELSDQEFKTIMTNMLRAKSKQHVRTD